jgi:hypothetical protein
MDLQEMNVKELRTLAAEMNIAGRSEMKKAELISAIEEIQSQQTTEEVTVEELAQETGVNLDENESDLIEAEEKPKPIKKVKRPLVLYNAENEVIERFDNQAECTKYCVSNSICNAGWVSCAIAESRPMYYTKEMKKTSPKAGKYHGVGYKIQYAVAQ